MRRSIRPALAALMLWLAVVAAVPAAGADPGSAVGTWKTIDDKTGKVRSVVRVYEQDGKLFARIERIFDAADASRRCTKCAGDRRDQPLIGLVVMRNMRLVDGEYRDGDILDPENGVTYRCKARLERGGTRLTVRGFVGVSLFGRSQTWERDE